MNTLVNDPRERAKFDASVLHYRVFTRRIRRMLYLGGVLQDRTRSATWSYITGLLVFLICFSQCVFSINFCRYLTNDLALFARCFGPFCSIIAPVLMSACFLVKRERLMELHETLNVLFERELARDRETKATMLATLYVFDRPSYILCFTLGLTSLLILYPSLIAIALQLVRHTESGGYRPLPILTRFFWPAPTGGFPFYLCLLHQTSIFWCITFTIGSVDSLFGYYAFQISSVLRAMSVRLMNSHRTQETFTQILTDCVVTHRRLLRCGHILNDIWGLIIIRMLIANAIVICTLIFEASPFNQLTLRQLIVFISFMTLKLLQTFIYAWYGSLITSASEHFREGIYFSEWPNSSLDHNIRTNVIVTMMQKPMIIKALNLSSINVNMFTNIVNTAMSYFFLLRSLDEGR